MKKGNILKKENVLLLLVITITLFLTTAIFANCVNIDVLNKKETKAFIKEQIAECNPTITFYCENGVKSWLKEEALSKENLGVFNYYIYNGCKISYFYYPECTKVALNVKYKVTKKDMKKINKKVKTVAKSCKGKTTTASIKNVNRYWKKYLSYERGQNNIAKAISNKKGNCYAYTMLTYLTFQKMGIKSTVVYGYTDGDEHIWNKVKVGKTWKYVDVTWNDYTNTNNYLLVSKKTLQKTHTFP